MLDYKNGYMKPVVPVSVGKGGEPIHFNQISQNELDELAKFQPTLTYGQAKQVAKTRDVAFEQQRLWPLFYRKQLQHDCMRLFVDGIYSRINGG